MTVIIIVKRKIHYERNTVQYYIRRTVHTIRRIYCALCLQPCAEWSMDSGCGTCTTGLTSVMSSVVSRTATSEPTAQQSSSNGLYQQTGQAVTQPSKRQPAPLQAVPATCPAKPQRRQPAISQYDKTDCFCLYYCLIFTCTLHNTHVPLVTLLIGQQEEHPAP